VSQPLHVRLGSREPWSDEPALSAAGAGLGRTISTRTARNRVARYALKANLERHVSPHTLRHTAITSWVRNGANLDQAGRAAGHACVKTTQRYLHEADEALNPAVALAPSHL